MKGSPLAILTSRIDPAGSMMLLPPCTKQIAVLEFPNSHWVDIRRYLEINPGPLPLPRTLNINTIQGIDPGCPPPAALYV